MSDNNIGPSGATDLANALKVNKTVREINLYGTLVFGDNAVWFNGVGTILIDGAHACRVTLTVNLTNPKP